MLRMMAAHRATGKAKSTIQRAIRLGKLSCTIGPDGQRRFDPAELQRWTGEPLRAPGPGRQAPGSPSWSQQADDRADDLLKRLDAAERECERLKADLDRERRDLDRQREIADKLLEMLDRRLLPAPAEQTTNVKPPPGTYSRQAPPAPTDQPGEPAFLSMLKAVTGRR